MVYSRVVCDRKRRSPIARIPTSGYAAPKGPPPRRGRPGLLAHFAFDEGSGGSASDRIDPLLGLVLHRVSTDAWSTENAPSRPPGLKGDDHD